MRLSHKQRLYTSGLLFIIALAVSKFLISFRLHGVVTGDHPVHFVRSMLLFENLLESGSLFGWTNLIEYGYPIGYLYPVLLDLFLACIQTLAAPLVGELSGYGIAVLFILLINATAIYAIAARLSCISVAVSVAIIFLFDYGEYQLGGWNWNLDVGVLANFLAQGLFLWSYFLLLRIIDGAGWRAVGFYSILLGAAMLAHPVVGPVMCHIAVCAVPAVLLCRRRRFVEPLRKFGVGFGIAVFIASGWAFVYLSVNKFAVTHTRQWLPLHRLWDQLVHGRLLLIHPYVLGLAVVGVVLLCIKRSAAHRLSGFVLLALIVVPSPDVLAFFKLDHLVSQFEYKRIATYSRPFILCACGFALYYICDRLRYLLNNLHVHSGMLVLLPLAFAAAIVWQTYDRGLISRARYPFEKQLLVERAEVSRELSKLIQDERQFFRIAVRDRVFRRYPSYAFSRYFVADLGYPVVFENRTAATAFSHALNRIPAKLLSQLDISYLLSTAVIPELSAQLIKTVGSWKIYKIKSTGVPLVKLAPRSEGTKVAGVVRLLHVGPQRIEWDVQGVKDNHIRLRINMRYFPRWKLYVNGKPESVSKTALPGLGRYRFMSAAAVNGRYSLRFERDLPELLAPIVTLCGLLMALYCILKGGGVSSVLPGPSRL